MFRVYDFGATIKSSNDRSFLIKLFSNYIWLERLNLSFPGFFSSWNSRQFQSIEARSGVIESIHQPN